MGTAALKLKTHGGEIRRLVKEGVPERLRPEVHKDLGCEFLRESLLFILQ